MYYCVNDIENTLTPTDKIIKILTGLLRATHNDNVIQCHVSKKT